MSMPKRALKLWRHHPVKAQGVYGYYFACKASVLLKSLL